MSTLLLTTKTRATTANEAAQLRELARLYGVETTYQDIQGRRKRPTPEGLLAVLRALGAPIEDVSGVGRALAERKRELWEQVLDPVAVVWDGGPAHIKVCLPSSQTNRTVECHLRIETGESRSWKCRLGDLPRLARATVGRKQYVVMKLALPGGLPPGYHRFSLGPPARAEALIISAPTRAYDAAPIEGQGKTWGVFLPLYALYSERSWGSGDFSDLEALLRWTHELGGAAVATLPLLATFLGNLCEPSPYAPVSRLFWNEFFLDVTRIPELAHCQPAQTLLSCEAVQNELATLRQERLVDYRRGMALKRRILKELACWFFCAGSTNGGGRQEGFRQYLEGHPMVEDYARFRATCERQDSPWPLWPQPQRDGKLADRDYNDEARRYHLYVQWLAHNQLEAVCGQTREQGTGLCLDLPLGLHSVGYDVWRWRDSFVGGISAGAPPDTFFTKGQVWSFPPLHPEIIRRQGYSYFIACLRHQLKHATILRIDHIMGFHRLFWIPEGLEPKDGTYVRYRADEFYAICSLESHRHRSWIVGENLGTVPPYVNPAMSRHNVKGMYVVQYELTPGRKLRPVPPDCVASLNTHDTPLLAGFWKGLDIEDQRQLELVSEAGAKTAHKMREQQRKSLIKFLKSCARLKNGTAEPSAVLRATLEHLAESAAPFVLVNLEDLWLETQPQNVPGTGQERPNWRRQAHHNLETFSQMPSVLDTLRRVNKYRS